MLWFIEESLEDIKIEREREKHIYFRIQKNIKLMVRFKKINILSHIEMILITHNK